MRASQTEHRIRRRKNHELSGFFQEPVQVAVRHHREHSHAMARKENHQVMGGKSEQGNG